MNKNQIDNLIRFSIAFHKSHNNLIMCDPSYIKEKWDKYIGFRPKPIDSSKAEIIQWRERWDVDDDTYNEVKGIINFIIRINERHFYNYSEVIWYTSDLITLFEEVVGPVERINKDLYNHLHPSIIKIIDAWNDDVAIGRDYQLCLLV